MTPEPPPPTWAIFDGFTRPRTARSWDELDALIARAFAYAEHRCAAFPTLLAQWNTCFSELNGDPCLADWRHFRPLQADREEAWSDWLQHFLSTSTTGRFAQQLFPKCGFAELAGWAAPQVAREVTLDGRRADLVIRWRDNTRSHVEVKVGDLALEKTVETARKLEQKYPAKWTHYLLLPSEDAVHWDEAKKTDPLIKVLRWDDVALALRRALREGRERLGWLVWAHGFCGLIEQRLLDHPVGGAAVVGLSDMQRRVRQILHMEEGLKDD